VIRVLVDALPTTNLSGRHVLIGHLSRVAPWTTETHRWTILYHHANADMRADFGSNVTWRECPPRTAAWIGRRVWQHTGLRRVVEEICADVILSPSGTTLPGCPTPQVVYAMNPWALVKGLEWSLGEKAKAALQRRAYARAMRDAAGFLFLSQYLRDAYRDNAGRKERASEIVYPGIDDDIFERAARRAPELRRSDQVVCASMMAAHKGVETVVEAIAQLRNRGVRVRLLLAGPWPDPWYAQRIDKLIAALRLADSVTITGRLPRADLHRTYRESRVFALMSRAESFGIPAAEAQAFGTPVVSSATCAIPEVCGAGGLYPAVGDVGATADAIGSLLNDRSLWKRTSEAARDNARRFEWSRCAPAFLHGIERGTGADRAAPAVGS
jgi:glycosyltransferase involved in cell wall biosynthesis